jgi:hypothetical protein
MKKILIIITLFIIGCSDMYSEDIISNLKKPIYLVAKSSGTVVLQSVDGTVITLGAAGPTYESAAIAESHNVGDVVFPDYSKATP